jgi:hypothetical protein
MRKDYFVTDIEFGLGTVDEVFEVVDRTPVVRFTENSLTVVPLPTKM